MRVSCYLSASLPTSTFTSAFSSWDSMRSLVCEQQVVNGGDPQLVPPAARSTAGCAQRARNRSAISCAPPPLAMYAARRFAASRPSQSNAPPSNSGSSVPSAAVTHSM